MIIKRRTAGRKRSIRPSLSGPKRTRGKRYRTRSKALKSVKPAKPVKRRRKKRLIPGARLRRKRPAARKSPVRVRKNKRLTGPEMYNQGFNQAYNKGYNDGFAKGFEDGHQIAYGEQP